MSEYFRFKIVLAFQLDKGDMFRAQEHLLTPSELGDRSSATWGHLENPDSLDLRILLQQWRFLDFRDVPKFQMTCLRAQMELECVLRL